MSNRRTPFELPLLTQDFTPRIHISEEDFDVMTRGGTLLDSEGRLHLAQFEGVMRDQISQFVRRQITNTLTVGSPTNAVESVQLSTLKVILHEQASSRIFCSDIHLLR